MERLTYKSRYGDYGCEINFRGVFDWGVFYKLLNALGPYEDLGLTPEEIRERLGLGK